MKRRQREDTARAEMYREGDEALAEHLEQWVGTRPGACDETFGGGRARKPKESKVVAMRAPTKLIGHALIALEGGVLFKRVSCKRCAGTGWDEGINVPCRKCEPLRDGTRGTTLVRYVGCDYFTLLKNKRDHSAIRR